VRYRAVYLQERQTLRYTQPVAAAAAAASAPLSDHHFLSSSHSPAPSQQRQFSLAAAPPSDSSWTVSHQQQHQNGAESSSSSSSSSKPFSAAVGGHGSAGNADESGNPRRRRSTRPPTPSLSLHRLRLPVSRRLARQSYLYVGALYLTYLPVIVTRATELAVGYVYYEMLLTISIFIPLQGFWNGTNSWNKPLLVVLRCYLFF